MGQSRYHIHEANHPHFLTCTIVGWQAIFTRPETVQIVLDSWQFMQDHERLTLYGYVVLENHLHLIASAPNLGKEIGDFKSYTARRIIDRLIEHKADMLLQHLTFHKLRHKQHQDYQVWQEGCHPELIQDDEMMLQKLEYIHNNSVKRGYVDNPIHWRYSSARNYEGMESLIPVQTNWQETLASAR